MSGTGHASDKGSDTSRTGGEIGRSGEHKREGSGAATVSVSNTDRKDTCAANNDARLRQHRPAATLPGSSLVVGRKREEKVWAETEDFFRDDGDYRDRSSRSKSHEATQSVRLEGEVAPHDVNMLADCKESCDCTKYLEGIYSGTVSRGVVGDTENRNIQGVQPSGPLSEESHNFLYSDDDGNDNSVTQQRRKDSGATNQPDRSTPGVPAYITRERFDYVGAGANVEHDEHDLEQKRVICRDEFDSFLFSDDESGILPGVKVCHAKYNGDGHGGGHDEGCTPERQRTRGLKEQEKGIGKRESEAGSDNDDTHGSLERGTQPRSKQGALTREQNTMVPHPSESEGNGNRGPSRTVIEASDRGGVGRGSRYDGDGGTPPTSVAASRFPTEQAPAIYDGARCVRHDSKAETRRAACKPGGVLSRVVIITAAGQVGAGHNPANPTCGGVDDNGRTRPPSWSQTGLVGQAESAMTSGIEAPPVVQDGEREGRAPWGPPTAATTGKKLPPRGRTGWRSPVATTQFREARTNDNKNGSKAVGGTSLQETYSAGGENSHWEVSNGFRVGHSWSAISSLNSCFAASRRCA